MEAQSAKLKIEFGKPHHGWLPVAFSQADFDLEFEASQVLNDPLADLVSCLLLVTQGVDGKVGWWLEPAELLFQFNITSRGMQLVISLSDNWHFVDSSSRKQIFCVESNYDAIVMPFWRALRKLNSTVFNEENKYPLPSEKLEKLTQLIKARR